MPRVIDFSQGNETDWNEVRLPEPILGEREIPDEEIQAIARAFDAPVGGFWPQFSTHGKEVPRSEASRAYDAAHAWLSGNATGPWSWSEHWTNHGHNIDVAVYVERVPDQVAFAAAHADLFGYRPTEASHLAKLAIERGVVAPYTARESFSRWCSENQGFAFRPAEDLGEEGMRVAFSHPELERMFAGKWAGRFVREEGGTYAGSTAGTTWRDSPTVWLDRNGGVGNVSGGPGPDGYAWTVATRFADVADALERDWGHAFRRGADGLTFSGPDYPRTPGREIPADFLAYVDGEADDYEAPHLPEELSAFRAPASGPSPR
jgi:hypothetical protein